MSSEQAARRVDVAGEAQRANPRLSAAAAAEIRARAAGLRVVSSADEQATPAEFYEGEIAGVTLRPLQIHTDQRGWLAELYRHDELPQGLLPAMAYISQTRPGVVRGPHEHERQTDCFAFLGPGDFELFLWDARPDSSTRFARLRRICGQSDPCVVIIPPGVVHAYRNVSDVDGWVFNAPDQLYAGYGKQEPVDEIRHENDPDSPYRID